MKDDENEQRDKQDEEDKRHNSFQRDTQFQQAKDNFKSEQNTAISTGVFYPRPGQSLHEAQNMRVFS